MYYPKKNVSETKNEEGTKKKDKGRRKGSQEGQGGGQRQEVRTQRPEQAIGQKRKLKVTGNLGPQTQGQGHLGDQLANRWQGCRLRGARPLQATRQ